MSNTNSEWEIASRNYTETNLKGNACLLHVPEPITANYLSSWKNLIIPEISCNIMKTYFFS